MKTDKQPVKMVKLEKDIYEYPLHSANYSGIFEIFNKRKM